MRIPQGAQRAAELTPEGPSGTFLALLSPAERDRLLQLGRSREFTRGAVLMYEGEPGERIMLIESGRVKVTRVEAGGQEVLLSLRDPGDIVGEIGFIDDGPRLASVAALEAVRARVIASSVFRAHLEAEPRVALALFELLTERFRDATVKRAQFSAGDTAGRLAARLVELVERYGVEVAGGIESELPLSQEELAAWTGASRAGVAKALQTLRDLGWIETHRRRIVVRDLEALKRRSA